jgi:hypothetical protein
MPLNMNHDKDDQYWLRFLPRVLPAVYILLAAVTAISGEKSATGGNPFFCVSLPVSLPMVARDDSPTVIIVAILATAWWYFIAQIGWSSTQGRISRSSSGLGAILIGFMITADSVLMISESFLISREPNFNAVDGAIYVLAGLLLSGGVISAAYSAMAAIGINRPGTPS